MPGGVRNTSLSFLAELQDRECQNTQDLIQGDASTADELIKTASLLLDACSLSEARAKVYAIVQHAHSAMASVPPNHSRGWRRIYTDARILLAYIDVQEYSKSGDATHAISAVGHLDHAIVIAGAPGDGRLDFVLDLIESIQSEDLSFTMPMDDAAKSTPPPIITANKPVPCLDTPPSLASFVSRLSSQPFVLPGFLRDWPALAEHPWRSLDYLRAVAGPGRVVPVEVGSDYRSDDWMQRMMRWEEFLESLKGSSGDGAHPVLYLAQHSLFTQFPALRDDIIVPDYVYSSLNAPSNYPQYTPPSNEDQLVLNAWLGPARTVSPAHTDPFYNFYAQVVGRKTIWLAPPEASPYMYPYSSTGSSSSLPDDTDHRRNPAANHENPSMSNTSRVDVFATGDDARGSKDLFPDFWREVPPMAMQVTLEPGDLLFFPPGWWHAMRSEDMSFSVSMWF
ncbi:Clavaminate synthase-like protein [Trametes sanguinea]|nr:Clavaminate synthase-like protein [Trametes sanguinea]